MSLVVVHTIPNTAVETMPVYRADERKPKKLLYMSL